MNEENVLFYCYKCEVNMVQTESDGTPTYRCPKCGDTAEFDFSKIDLNKIIRDSGGWLDEKLQSSEQKTDSP